MSTEVAAVRGPSTDYVLIVEDDANVRDSLAAVLQDEGYLVATARNGQEALSHLQTHPAPRLILLDLMMPVMDGQRFRLEQLKDPVISSIRVAVLSADRDGRQKAKALGVEEFLQKPIDLEGLLQLVERGS